MKLKRLCFIYIYTDVGTLFQFLVFIVSPLQIMASYLSLMCCYMSNFWNRFCYTLYVLLNILPVNYFKLGIT
jgi:hypothetical protein